MELYPLSLSRLQYVELGQFIVRLQKDTGAMDINIEKDNRVMSYLFTLDKAFKDFNLGLKQIAGQKETEDLIVLDRQRDNSIIMLRNQIDVFKRSRKEIEREACKMAKRVMKNYKDIERANYEAESLAIENLLSEWNKSENAGCVKILNLQGHLNEVKDTAAAFNKKFDTRSLATSIQVVYNTKELRGKMVSVYKRFVEYVVVMATQENADVTHIELMESINNGRRYFADILARREGLATANDTPNPPASES